MPDSVQGAADQRVQIPARGHADSHRIGRSRVFTDRAQIETGPRAIDEIPQYRHQDERAIHDGILRKEDLTEHRDLRQTRQRHAAEHHWRLSPDEWLTEDCWHTRAEQG